MKPIIRRALWIVSCLVLLTMAVSFWLAQDEAALDYSSMEVEIGPTDPDLNGYSLLREFSLNYTDMLSDAYVEYFWGEQTDVSPQEMSAWLATGQDLLNTVRTALNMPIYKIDEPMRPETLMFDVGIIRNYVQLRIIEIDKLLIEGNVQSAFEHFISLHEDVDRFWKAEGVLIQYLSSIALQGIFNKAVQDFINSEVSNEILSNALIEFAQSYQLHQGYAESTVNALKHEFQFTKYCTELLDSDPIQMTQGVSATYSFSSKVYYNLQTSLFFDPNNTNNCLYLAYKEIIDQADRPLSQKNYSVARELINFGEGNGPSPLNWSNKYGATILGILFPAVESVLVSSTVSHTNSEATRSLLALRAYVKDYNTLPESLSQLVPDYLDTLPVDPFDGEPLRYSKSKKILYSVGEDFIDQGGSQLPYRYDSPPEDDDIAETDRSEPTYPIRFAM